MGEGEASFRIVIVKVQEYDSTACIGHETAVQPSIGCNLMVNPARPKPACDPLG